jgi:hypothetical protein
MPDTKWQHERQIAKRFLRLLGEREPALSRPAGPHPDVLWQSPEGAIGLELTRLVSDQRLVERENIREQILALARAAATSLPIDDLFVWVHWHDWAPDPRIRYAEIAKELIAVVGANLPPQGARLALGSEYDFDRKFIHPVFDRITIDRTVRHGGVSLATFYSDWLKVLTVEDLRSRIEEKSAKNRSGIPPLHEHWLVIYGGFGPLSARVEPEPDVLEYVYTSIFNRVYLTFLSGEQQWQLLTAPRALGLNPPPAAGGPRGSSPDRKSVVGRYASLPHPNPEV